MTRRRRPVLAVLAAAVLLHGLPRPTVAAAPAARPPCAACIVWSASLAAAERLSLRSEPLAGADVIVRAEGDDPESRERLAAVLGRLTARGARAGAEVAVGPPDAIAAVARGARLLLLRAEAASAADPAALAFAVKQAAVAARAVSPGLLVGLAGPAGVLGAARGEGVSPYVDFVVPEGGAAGTRAADAWDRRGAPAPGETLLDALRVERRTLIDLEEGKEELAVAAAALRPFLPAGLTPLGAVTVACLPATPGCAVEVYLDPDTLDAVAVVQGAEGTLVVTPGASGAEAVLVGPEGARAAPAVLERAGAPARLALPAAPAVVLRLTGWTGYEPSFASAMEIEGRRSPTLEEILAHHQAAAARLERRARVRIATGSTVLTFQVPGLAAPVTLTSSTVEYRRGGMVEVEQRDLRLNGARVDTGKDAVPRLPLVEPERVGAPPLAIALDETYGYRLAGRERTGGRLCWVIAFASRDGLSGPRLDGRAWIAEDDYALVRVEAVETGLRGAIVSAREVDEYAALPGGGWTLARSESHQIYEGPGHRTPVDREVRFTSTEIDPPDFDRRLAAAHASTSVMLRDTPAGYRYLRRDPQRREKDAPAGSEPAPARTLAAPATSVRSIAAGVLVDPNISHPVPFAGLSLLDLDFLGTGAQVSALLAGPFVQASWAVPRVRGGAWRLEGTAFGSLVRYNERVFVGGRERYEENLRQRPVRASLMGVRRLGRRARARIGYEAEAMLLDRADTTAPAFVVPRHTVVHGLRVGLDFERGRWSATAWASGHRRSRWGPWGMATDGNAGGRGFTKAGITLSRSVVLSRAAVARVEAGGLAGRGLDRFSRFSFDAFESRLRGYPAAELRFDRGAVLRTALAWDSGRGLRLDSFADGALVHDPGLGRAARGHVGVGAAAEIALPRRALLVVDWGYGVQARGTDGRRGTHTVRVTAYKVF